MFPNLLYTADLLPFPRVMLDHILRTLNLPIYWTCPTRAPFDLPLAMDRPFQILDLPLELVGEICGHALPEDLLSVRLTCKAFHESSKAHFGCTFFEELVLVLHPVSLSRFLDIAKHVELCKYAKTVTFSLEEFPGARVPGSESTADEVEPLELSGDDFQDLYEALRRLVCIRHVKTRWCAFTARQKVGRVRCAAMLLDRYPYPWKNREACSYAMVLKVLHELELDSTVKLDLQLVMEVPTLFDQGDSSWNANACQNVRRLDIELCEPNNFPRSILRSTANVEDLMMRTLRLDPRLVLPSNNIGPWSQLKQLTIEGFCLKSSDLCTLLKSHSSTLLKCCIFECIITNGTWAGPLGVIRRELHLTEIHLSLLFGFNPPVNMAKQFDSYYKDVDPKSGDDAHAIGTNIAVYLDDVLGDLRMRPTGFIAFPLGPLPPGMGVLDFRRANAFQELEKRVNSYIQVRMSSD